MIELRGVTKHRPGFTLGPVDLTIKPGFVTGFVGANGAGKTTTLKVLLGMVTPDAGEVSRPAMTDIGVVLDVPPYEPEWHVSTVGKVLAPFYPRWSDATFQELLGRFDVPLNRKVRTLSRGMAMKLQIAAAFAHDARLLVLDEPTSGLDPLSRDELVGIIGDFMMDEHRTVLFSSHITSDIERIADYVAVIDKGQIIAHSERSDLMDSYVLVRGGSTPLETDIVSSAYGIRSHTSGWDALLPARYASQIPADAVAEPPSLDDLVVRIAKGH
ncbi:MAG: ABC transporter ATP-binding protein [Propionibacterium sp.]|nr:ABC transporter ATP-binding protein [Propionibacterium sp.]